MEYVSIMSSLECEHCIYYEFEEYDDRGEYDPHFECTALECVQLNKMDKKRDTSEYINKP